jgi:hypothetical protein
VLTTASFATAVRGGIESRGMPKFAELSDRELDALRNYVRQRARLVTRPKGVAPPEPAKPAQDLKPQESQVPPKPSGSLESTGAPPPN